MDFNACLIDLALEIRNVLIVKKYYTKGANKHVLFNTYQ